MHKVVHSKNNFPNGQTIDYGSQVPVAEGKLVLVECKPEEALIVFGKPNLNAKPIIISETEKIEVGDWFYTNLKHIKKCVRIDGKAIYFYNEEDQYEYLVQQDHEPFKILALPEHFSLEQLKMIVNGKLKGADKVLVECELACHKHKSLTTDVDTNCTCGIPASHCIKFNSSNHVTLHKIEEKMYNYTRKELEQLLYKAMLDSATNATGSRQFLPTFYKEWFKQNVK